MLSCEGQETANMNQQVLFDYTASGGRVLASHLHYAWFTTGPFASYDLAAWAPGTNYLGDINAAVVTALPGGPFVRGQALHDWLAGPKVKALVSGLLPLPMARHNADLGAANTRSQPWLVVAGAPQQAQAFTFDTPFSAPAGAQCGRVVYTEMHVGIPEGYAPPPKITPGDCPPEDFSPEHSALEYMLFDVTSCVTANNAPMVPP
jgi:hypothetical protein